MQASRFSQRSALAYLTAIGAGAGERYGDRCRRENRSAVPSAAFVEDMRAYHADSNATRRDEIAERQLYALRPFNLPWAKKLQLSDVIELFQETNDQA